MDPCAYESLRNQTLLFFIEKLLEKSPRSLHDLSCQFGSKNFSKEMRQIAGGSQSGLKKFLIQYPSIFTVDEDMVSYASEIKQKYGRDYNKEAVEYFRNRLLQYGFNVRVPIKSLLGHRSQANTEIRHVSGQHISQFREFLEKNSEFVLSDEFVWLKEFEHEKITEFKEVNILNYDKEIVFKLCKFFVNLIGDKGPMLVEQLFHQVGVEFDAGEFETIFKNPNDLGVFLKIQPQCFQVHSNLVTLSESYSIGLEIIHRQSETTHKFTNPNPQLQRTPSFSNNNSTSIQPTTTVNTTKNLPINNQNPTTGPPPPPNQIQQQQNPNPQSIKNSLKQRVSSILIQTLSQNNEKDYKTPPLHQSQGTEEERSRSAILSKVTIVSNKRKAKETVEHLLNEEYLGVDCEGVNLGIDGRVTILQVALPQGLVFIFDLLSEGLADELKCIMESDTIIKIMHDCRNDSVNLFRQYNIQLKNIFDTQAAHLVIQSESGQKTKNISLNNLCEVYGVEINKYKDKVKSVYRYDQRYWLRRPLTPQMQSYAASDVITLIKLYPLLKPKLKNFYLFQELCFEQIQAHINPQEIKAKRRLRKNEGDIKELQLKLDNCPDLSKLVLSNREVRLIKHMGLSDSTLDQLSNSLKIAKKLQKSQLSDSSSESNLTSLESSNTLDSGCFNTPPDTHTHTPIISTTEKINSIERLIDKIFSPSTKVNNGTQTVSTGDIVLSKIYDPDQN